MQPWERIVDLVCQEFRVDPPRAVALIERDRGLLWEVLDVRSFCRAWDAMAAYDAARQHSPEATEPAIGRALKDRVREAQYGRLQAMKAAREVSR